MARQQTHIFKLELDFDTVRFLRILGDPRQVLHDLALHAADGVRRPGAWERGWVTQVFGDEWTNSLEDDPEADWRQRPMD